MRSPKRARSVQSPESGCRLIDMVVVEALRCVCGTGLLRCDDVVRLGAASSPCYTQPWPLLSTGDFKHVVLQARFLQILAESLRAMASATCMSVMPSDEKSGVYCPADERAHRAAMMIVVFSHRKNQKGFADAGVVPALGSLALQSGTRSQASSVWALAHMSMRYAPDFESYHIPNAVWVAMQLLMQKSVDVRGKAALLIAEYADNVDDFAVDVVNAGAMPYLEHQLHDGSYGHRLEALEAIHGLTIACSDLESPTDKGRALVKVSHVFPYVCKLLGDSSKDMRASACRVLVSILQSSTNDNQHVAIAERSGCIQSVFSMKSANEIDVHDFLLVVAYMVATSHSALCAAMRYGLVAAVMHSLRDVVPMIDHFLFDVGVDILQTICSRMGSRRYELAGAGAIDVLRLGVQRFGDVEFLREKAERLITELVDAGQ